MNKSTSVVEDSASKDIALEALKSCIDVLRHLSTSDRDAVLAFLQQCAWSTRRVEPKE